MRRLLNILLLPLLVQSCGGDVGAEEPEDEVLSADSVPAAVDEDPLDMGQVTLNLYTIGETLETMNFEPNRLTVAPGADLQLVLMNKAKDPAMIHNVVVIRPGNQSLVVDAALEAGPDENYIPDSPYIVAATKLVEPGNRASVEFQAPMERGTYQFICTYPGHTSKKGILLVE